MGHKAIRRVASVGLGSTVPSFGGPIHPPHPSEKEESGAGPDDPDLLVPSTTIPICPPHQPRQMTSEEEMKVEFAELVSMVPSIPVQIIPPNVVPPSLAILYRFTRLKAQGIERALIGHNMIVHSDQELKRPEDCRGKENCAPKEWEDNARAIGEVTHEQNSIVRSRFLGGRLQSRKVRNLVSEAEQASFDEATTSDYPILSCDHYDVENCQRSSRLPQPPFTYHSFSLLDWRVREVKDACKGTGNLSKYNECKKLVEKKNAGIIGVSVAISIVFLLLFTMVVINKGRRAKARRRTGPPIISRELYSETRLDQTGGISKSPWKARIHTPSSRASHPETNEQREMHVSFVPIATLDGANDGWTRWIHQKRGNTRHPRPLSPVPWPRAPRIPSLNLPKPTLATVRKLSGIPDFGGSMACGCGKHKGKGKWKSDSKSTLNIRWGAAV